jgi:hypothetical protein
LYDLVVSVDVHGKGTCFAEIQRLKQDTILASISAPHFVLQREPRRAAELIAQFVQGL